MSFKVGDLVVPTPYAHRMHSKNIRTVVMEVVETQIEIKDIETVWKDAQITDELRKMMVNNDTSNEDIIKFVNKNYILVKDESDDNLRYVDKRLITKFTGDASLFMGGSPKRSRTKKNKTVRRSRIKNSRRVRRSPAGAARG